METPNSLAFKLESPPRRIRTRLQQDSRIGAAEVQKARWFNFELTIASDVRDALGWIDQAYVAAQQSKK
jgi:hypothetical protein